MPARSMLVSLAAVAAFSITSVVGAGSAPADPATDPVDGRPVPEGFRLGATTWTSPATGWVLGETTCDGEPCAATIRTLDGGRHWSLTGTLTTPLAESGGPGVTEVAFADPLHGWAYGPSLHATSDGGRRWEEAAIPAGDSQVLAVAGNPFVVYAVTSPCEIGQPAECSDPATLWRSAPALAARGIWHEVPGVDLPVASAATLAVEGPTAYVLVPQPPPQPDTFYATEDTHSWPERPSPCDPSLGETLVDVAPRSPRDVALLCVAQSGFSRAVKNVYRSDDTGRTTTSAGTAPELGIRTELAVAPDGTLALASVSSGSWIYLNEGGTTWTTPVALADGGNGWNDLVLTTPRTGWVVYDPAPFTVSTSALFTTDDGGQTWGPVDLTG